MRQGKLSELIHNSGPAPLSAEETEAAELAAAASEANGNGNTNGNDEGDDGEFEEEEESDEEDYSKKKGKGKGKGKEKTKRKEIVDASGLIGSCTVEVWFREIIDLVSSLLALLLLWTTQNTDHNMLNSISLVEMISLSYPIRSWS
jgi:structural maintenance of chromosome 4